MYLYGILGDISKGFYVDVGANHERLHSVTKLFYDIGWSGINIEPNPKLIKEFKSSRRRDINIQCGISDQNGELSFREYPDFDGLSTVSEDIMKLNESRNLPYIEYQIPVKTLEEVFAEHKVKTIDFLKIDIEGHELHALRGNDWKKYRPKVVIFEGTVGDKCINFLKKQNYRLEFFDGLNYYMIDKIHKKLSIHNFAGSVLSKGLYTCRETQLMADISKLEKEKTEILKKQPEIIHESIMNAIVAGVGIKSSLLSLKSSILKKINKYIK